MSIIRKVKSNIRHHRAEHRGGKGTCYDLRVYGLEL